MKTRIIFFVSFFFFPFSIYAQNNGEGKVHFMSESLWEYLTFTMQRADSLGLKFGIFNSDGWSMSGGPWITAEESMKKLVWADKIISGGSTVELRLPGNDNFTTS